MVRLFRLTIHDTSTGFPMKLMMLLIGCAACKICFDQLEALTRSG